MAVDEFRDWFRDQLDRHGYSLQGFARLAGVSAATAQSWKRGAIPQWRQTVKIADALHVDVWEVRKAAGYQDDVESVTPAPTVDQLSTEEQALVHAWRVAPRMGRRVLMDAARAIADEVGEYAAAAGGGATRPPRPEPAATDEVDAGDGEAPSPAARRRGA